MGYWTLNKAHHVFLIKKKKKLTIFLFLKQKESFRQEDMQKLSKGNLEFLRKIPKQANYSLIMVKARTLS